MIKPPMTAVIAERKIDVILPEGKAGKLTIQIGRPGRDPNPNGDWYCPVCIRGMSKERVRSFFGIDPLQALQFALGLLDLEVRAFAGPYQLSWLEHADLGLKPWFPKRKIKKAQTRKFTTRFRRP